MNHCEDPTTTSSEKRKWHRRPGLFSKDRLRRCGNIRSDALRSRALLKEEKTGGGNNCDWSRTEEDVAAVNRVFY